MKNKRVCPNCVADMEKEVRSHKAVHVCPECGVVEMNSEEQDSLIIKTRKDDQSRRTDSYYDNSEQDIIYNYIQQKDSSDVVGDI
jgi:Zn-finger nucleic acid-binding protein